jgi:hypothetical protein
MGFGSSLLIALPAPGSRWRGALLSPSAKRRREKPMSEGKLHKELDQVNKLLAVMIEDSGGEVVIAEGTLESLPDDIEIWRDELPEGFRLRTIRPNDPLRADVLEQTEMLDEPRIGSRSID